MNANINKQSQVASYCVDKILEQSQNPLLVAITGESGSGKSHFTKRLENELTKRKVKYSFINHDDFLIPRNEREKLRKNIYKDGVFKGKSEWEILENWYYLDDFHEILKKLKGGEAVTYYPYLHDGGKISNKQKSIMPNRIILLENKLFLDEMDYVIELKVDRQNIINRKIERDSDVRTPEQTIEMHKNAQGYFWDRQRPEAPNIVIDNNDYRNPILISRYNY